MAVKLFVGGLSFSTSNERLREVFAATGSVESAAVVTDRDTGRSRGFGFVEMTNDAEAENAIAALNGADLDGRTMTINEARPKEDRGFGNNSGGNNSRPYRSNRRQPRW